MPSEKFQNISELREGDYAIDAFRLIKTKFGLRLGVLIRRNIVFLPCRFAKHISSQEDVDELNQTRYIMKYDGMLRDQAVIHFKKVGEFVNELIGYDTTD